MVGSLDGTVSRDKLTTITFTLFGMLNWMYAWYDPKRTLRAEEVSHIIYDIFTTGVASYLPPRIAEERGLLCR